MPTLGEIVAREPLPRRSGNPAHGRGSARSRRHRAPMPENEALGQGGQMSLGALRCQRQVSSSRVSATCTLTGSSSRAAASARTDMAAAEQPYFRIAPRSSAFTMASTSPKRAGGMISKDSVTCPPQHWPMAGPSRQGQRSGPRRPPALRAPGRWLRAPAPAAIRAEAARADTSIQASVASGAALEGPWLSPPTGPARNRQVRCPSEILCRRRRRGHQPSGLRSPAASALSRSTAISTVPGSSPGRIRAFVAENLISADRWLRPCQRLSTRDRASLNGVVSAHRCLSSGGSLASRFFFRPLGGASH